MCRGPLGNKEYPICFPNFFQQGSEIVEVRNVGDGILAFEAMLGMTQRATGRVTTAQNIRLGTLAGLVVNYIQRSH